MPPGLIDLSAAGPEPRPLTVSEFTRRVRDLLVGGIGACSVKGEVSNLRVQPTGHAYFTLKDAGAQLSPLLFRPRPARQSVRRRDGLQVGASGNVGAYEPQGKYQLVVKTLVDD